MKQSLFNPYSLRATTFHAFCQELLQRFPLEAGISPGFELSEATGLLEQQARDALVNESSNKGHPINQALDRLIEALRRTRQYPVSTAILPGASQ